MRLYPFSKSFYSGISSLMANFWWDFKGQSQKNILDKLEQEGDNREEGWHGL